MKKLPFVSILLLCIFFDADAQDTLRKIENNAFRCGELIRFRVYYGWISAGYATLEIKPEMVTRNGRESYRCVGIGESVGAFDWFFKVRDRYETYVDKDMIAPLLFVRRVDEGGYKITQDYVFNHAEKRVFTGKEFKEIPAYIQDMISAFYFARCIDFSKAKEGDKFSIPCFVDDSLYYANLKFIRRETIKTDLGTFKCILFRPVIQTGRIFKHEEDLNVWISDDENKVPIRAQASILVGSIKMDLVNYSGLTNPLAKVEK